MNICPVDRVTDREALWEMWGAPDGSDDWETARKLAANCPGCYSYIVSRAHDKVAEVPHNARIFRNGREYAWNSRTGGFVECL